jgi:hypothetical protein
MGAFMCASSVQAASLFSSSNWEANSCSSDQRITFYVTQDFITVPTTARHWTLSWVTILALPFHLLKVLFSPLSLFWKIKEGLWDHLAVCVHPLFIWFAMLSVPYHRKAGDQFFPEFILNIIFHPCIFLPGDEVFPSDFPTKIVYAFISPVHITRPAHLILRSEDPNNSWL